MHTLTYFSRPLVLLWLGLSAYCYAGEHLNEQFNLFRNPAKL